jgi:aryl carrier-like protein
LKSLDPHPAFDAMAELYGAGAVQATVARIDWATFKPFLESHGPDPLLEGITVGAGAAAAQQAPPAAPAEVGVLADGLQTYLRTHLADALGYEPDQIDVDQPLVSLGLDSLRAVTLRSDILMDHDVDVAIEDLVGDCTITTLTALLEQNGAARTVAPATVAPLVESAVPDAPDSAPATAKATSTADDIEGYLRDQVADALGYAPDEIDPDQPLVALGLDSLRAVTIQSNIVTDLGVTITVENLVGDGSITSLTALLQEEVSAASGAAPDQDVAGEFDMVEGEL